ncbi:ABC transporter ATP-binding protein [Meridianimaribacter flavus]|uniref:Lipopolysaccharide transport system ATP-binding protein n=1 Tax=Meridianimaribacter flavus TaxID=571115 RepID=A0ABY2G5J9_9FLAO|nr:ABC transporter ATP-binding protein [Meridianimaribacter flavus]TDY11767.1 lipopolysaccharide transport system ATP-binding protein [Meridianimaribacter flavus]
MSNIQHNNEVLVKVEGLSKKFCKDLKTSLWYGVKDLLSGIRGSQEESQLRAKEFWAVKDINFELRRGECLGLIGHNGAGKSTLLKILNGLINPDAGKVTIRGRVGALIELGAGFNPILTGRENIYNNGAVLGFSRKEIDSKLEAIIAFAELDEFIDMPVQHYSSGMKVRLGFAVAAQMEPDVLIIDEVLAVGDVGFRMKCLTRIGELLKTTAVIFVSHTMPQVARIANKIILLKHGESIENSVNVSSGIEKYYNEFQNTDKIIGGNGLIKLKEFNIYKDNRALNNNEKFVSLEFNKSYVLRLKLNVSHETRDYFVNFSFIDKDAKQVANFYSVISNNIFNEKGIVDITAKIDNLILGQGTYTIGVAINEIKTNGARGDIYYYDSNIKSINVVGVPTGHSPIQFYGDWDLNKI